MVEDGPAVAGMADRMTIVASNDVCEDSLVKLNAVRLLNPFDLFGTLNAVCLPTPADTLRRESSLLTTYWSESTLSS